MQARAARNWAPVPELAMFSGQFCVGFQVSRISFLGLAAKDNVCLCCFRLREVHGVHGIAGFRSLGLDLKAKSRSTAAP